MRYEDLVRQYLSIRNSSSREWRISDRMVMCVEIDMSADTHVTMAVASSSSQRRSGMKFLRMTLFVAANLGERQWYGVPLPLDGKIAAFYSDGVPRTLEHVELDHDERARIEWYQYQVDDWRKGMMQALPASTSTEILDKLQRKA